MKISYDKATDSLYIHLADRASGIRTKSMTVWCLTLTLTALWLESTCSTPA